MDEAFDLDLLTVIRGQDRKGQGFEMTAILAGRGKLLVFYDRDGIVYRNDRLGRDFKLASRVEFATPVAGVLEDVHGLCAKVLLFGCVRIRSIVKVGETVEVRAGTFTSKSRRKAIEAREGRTGQAGCDPLRRPLHPPRGQADAPALRQGRVSRLRDGRRAGHAAAVRARGAVGELRHAADAGEAPHPAHRSLGPAAPGRARRAAALTDAPCRSC